MATQQTIEIPKHTDDLLWDVFSKASAMQNNPGVTLVAYGDINLGVVSATDSNKFLEDILAKKSTLIRVISVGFGTLQFSINREESGFIDKLVIHANPQGKPQITDDEKVALIDHFLSKLASITSGSGAIDVKSIQQIESAHLATLERLEKLNEELISRSSEFRRSVEGEYAKKAIVLEEQYSQKDEKLSEDYRVQKEDLSASEDKKRKELQGLEDKLREKIKAVDDRDNTHVRRGLREELQALIVDRSTEFTLTKGTNNLRVPIHFTCILLITCLGIGTAWYANQLFGYLQNEEVDLVSLLILSVKQLAITGAMLATSIFYLRWMNKWFEQHSEAEFQLKQFQLDIDRASWVVETALEWKASMGSSIPEELMHSISRNLFEREMSSETAEVKPADALASALLGTASLVKVKTPDGGSELEFRGKDLRKET